MIIKCGKEAHIYSILLIIAFLLISISFTNSIEGGVLGFLILSPLMIACISSYEKVLIMDSKGCTVKLFCFSKTYKWSELKQKNTDISNTVMRITKFMNPELYFVKDGCVCPDE